MSKKSSRSWPVGTRTCTITVQRPKPGAVVNAVIAWAPNQPARLSTDEWAEYRAGRNHALSLIAAEFGINAAVLEI